RTSGPVVPIIEVKDTKEAVSISNSIKYGLRVSVFTNNLRDALYAIHNLQVGGVMINENPFYVEEHFPVGGVKESGIGGVGYLVEIMTTKKLIAIHDIYLG
ncbi:MAG: aldehyde dehydrogenase family protein, partial [Candidatus Altiarchaeales archaeon]|nr:aldehyde dehydrogenase family protein [Candidatus Altiarchaeales archaeon]